MRAILPLTLVLVLLCLLPVPALAICTGSFINPVNDVCWSCMFPMRIGGISFGTPMTVGGGGEQIADPTDDKTDSPACVCISGSQQTLGLMTKFWEHARLIETVKDPYCFPALGTSIATAKKGLKAGEHKGHATGQEATVYSFNQVHYYIFPVWQLLEIFTDFPCTEKAPFDLAYMTEVDPLWSDDTLSVLINPEALLFGNPVTQLSCIADSAGSIVGYPLDALFWCFGSWGSPYPLTGSVATAHTLDAHANVASRMIFKLGRQMELWDTGVDECAAGVITPIMIKSHYRLQIARPVKGGQCVNIGSPSFLWGAAKNPPMGAGNNSPDNFLWLMARKRKCCVGYNLQ